MGVVSHGIASSIDDGTTQLFLKLCICKGCSTMYNWVRGPTQHSVTTRYGEEVAVFGVGVIGLLVTAALVRLGLRVTAVDPDAPRIAKLLDLVARIQGLPRHLGQHSGGIVIAAGRLDEVVPIEPARMAARRVVQ